MRKLVRYLLVLLLVVLVGGWFLRSRLRGPTIKPGSYLLLEVSGSYAEAPPQDMLGRLMRRQEQTLIDLVTMIHAAQVDTRITGLILKLGGIDMGWAKLQDLRDALSEFKIAGKPVTALLEDVAGGNREYYLASVAERVYLAPTISAPLRGLAAHFYFLGGVWDKLDIDMHVEKIGEYKTFGDMLANREMTPAHREMANALLDSLDEQFVSGLAQGRRLDPTAVRALIDHCPVTPAEFESARLSDGTRHLQDIREEIGKDTPLVKSEDYAHVDPQSVGVETGPRIAVVYGVGAIASGESGVGMQGPVMGAETVQEALREAAEDDTVRAIVFRVDSPGGSALASDVVWRATQYVRSKKPIVASMSDVAASGGYYISAGANHIVAQPGTLTGSIGVVVARPNVRGLLKRFGINSESMSRGRYALVDDLTTPLTPEGKEKLTGAINHIYDVFVERVASGRNLSLERVDEIGRGRVWTGEQAKANGLVDVLGGFTTALRLAKEAAGIDAGQEVELVFYPRPKGFVQRLSEFLSTDATLAIPASWARALRLLTLPFEDGTLLTLMPEVVEVR